MGFLALPIHPGEYRPSIGKGCKTSAPKLFNCPEIWMMLFTAFGIATQRRQCQDLLIHPGDHHQAKRQQGSVTVLPPSSWPCNGCQLECGGEVVEKACRIWFCSHPSRTPVLPSPPPLVMGASPSRYLTALGVQLRHLLLGKGS